MTARMAEATEARSTFASPRNLYSRQSITSVHELRHVEKAPARRAGALRLDRLPPRT